MIGTLYELTDLIALAIGAQYAMVDFDIKFLITTSTVYSVYFVQRQALVLIVLLPISLYLPSLRYDYQQAAVLTVSFSHCLVLDDT